MHLIWTGSLFRFKTAEKVLLMIICLFLLMGCGIGVTRPRLEMGLAAAAFQAAKDAKAYNVAPSIFRKAELYYIRAKSAYKRKYFNKAQQYFNLSRAFSEQAEFLAKKRKLESE